MDLRAAAATITLIAAVGLAGCAPASPDAAYLSTVREKVPALAGAPDADLTRLGEQVCDTLDKRGFADGLPVFIRVARDSGLTASDAGAIAGAATAAYCPEFADEF